MTTTVPSNNTLLQPSLYNIQYPNARTGMFSLRQPFKDMSTVAFPPELQQTSPTNVPLTDLNTEQQKSAPPRQKSKRSAQVQCSLFTPTKQHNVAVQTKIDRKPKSVDYIDDADDYDYNVRPRRHRKQLPLDYHQKVYEIWDVDSSPVQSIPMNPTRHHGVPARVPRQRIRQPMIEYLDDDEFESDPDNVRIVYARQPPQKVNRKTHLPPNVQMICVRDEANRASH